LTPDDIPRLAKLGIVASMQPLHAIEDMHFAESRMGPERLKYAYIWSDLLDLGVVVATGTDYSVSPYNPFYTLHAAITRQDRDNNPPGGWIPEQALTREEALRAATMAGAYVMFAEDILGSIEVGKLADFVVIPVDYMTIPAEDIWKIKPEMTVIGGEIVYTRPVQAQK
jgi:predicted amidohydrolase YtcJ